MTDPGVTVAGETISTADFLAGCRRHAHWFVPFVLDVDHSRLHDDFQWWLDETRDGYAELPRGHGKTSQMTARYAWEIGRNPEIRIKNVGSNDQESAKSVRLVRDIIDSDRFRMVFPEIEPDPDNWGATSLTVKRRKLLRDPTIEAVSIFGRAGGRADILAFDDICDPRNSIQQPMLREQVKDFWKTLWLPTVDVSTPGYRIWKTATPYHVDDATAEWRVMHSEDGTLFRRPCVGTHSSPWPEVYTPDVLAQKLKAMGPLAYARAYELRPLSGDEVVFQADWIDRSMYRTPLPQTLVDSGTRIGAVDFAFTEKTAVKPNPDWSVFAVGLVGPDRTLYLERVWRLRTTFPEFKRLVARESRLLKVSRIWGESQGPLAGPLQELQREVPCAVIGLPRVADKYTRAVEAQEFVMNGKLRFRMDSSGRVAHDLQAAYDEITTFPAGDHDDTVDVICDMIVHGCKTASFGRSSLPAAVRSGRGPLWRVFGGR